MPLRLGLMGGLSRCNRSEKTMIRYFCDCCGGEIAERDIKDRNPLDRLAAELKKGNSTLRVEVIESKDGVGNAGHFCRYCVLDALAKLDDRPRAA
jgi:hypothetical protein